MILARPRAAIVPDAGRDRDTRYDFAEPASISMRKLADSIDDTPLGVGEFIDRMQHRGQGLVLLMLALPMCIPNIPGISTLFGVLLIAPALRMISGQPGIWLPKRVRNWSIDGAKLRQMLYAASRILGRVEHFSRPRWRPLSEGPALVAAGVQTLIMALVLILPLWGANLIPGIAVSLTGLGMLQRDGVAMAASVPIALGALVWVYLGARYTIAFFVWLSQWLGEAVHVITGAL